MSEITRYRLEAVGAWEPDAELYEHDDPSGEWVRYSDHAPLLATKDAEIARLQARIEKAEAEVERLRADIEQRCAVAVNNARPVIADSVRRETVDRIKAGLSIVPMDGECETLADLYLGTACLMTAHPDWLVQTQPLIANAIERLAYPEKEDGNE